MITFSDPAERELVAELKEAGLLTPIIMEQISRSLARSDRAGLDDFLLAGAPFIPERDWLSWLIRRHRCYRFGPVRLAADAETWKATVVGPNLPYLQRPSGDHLVGILRPDLPAGGWRAAATLSELGELRKAWNQLRR